MQPMYYIGLDATSGRSDTTVKAKAKMNNGKGEVML
jgi:hypothetical protein